MDLIKKEIISLIILLFLQACGRQPDFITFHQIEVFTNNINVSPTEFEEITEFFINQLLELSPRKITEEDLYYVFNHLQIEIRKKIISWNDKKYSGLQQGKYILLHYPGNLEDSALIHEYMHAVDEIKFGRYDYGHTDRNWWDTERQISLNYREYKNAAR